MSNLFNAFRRPGQPSSDQGQASRSGSSHLPDDCGFTSHHQVQTAAQLEITVGDKSTLQSQRMLTPPPPPPAPPLSNEPNFFNWNQSEMEGLKTFTIPKKRSSKKDLIEGISLTSREYIRELLPTVTKSFKDPSSPGHFQFTHANLVHNQALEDAYVERKKEMRSDGYSEKDVSDSYGFLCVDTEQQAKRIGEDGISVGNAKTTTLGDPSMGVYLSRHADLVKPSGIAAGYRGRLMVFKYIKGKAKTLVENRSGPPLEPTPNYDAHISKNANIDLSSTSPLMAFESTQVYLYEYGDLGPEERPRQICPYAYLSFVYVGKNKSNTLGSTRKIKPESTSQRKMTSSPWTSTNRSQMALSKKKLPTPEQMPTRIGQEVDGGMVVWEGHLASKATKLCAVELVTYGAVIKPACIGPMMDICGRIPLSVVRTKYLPNLMGLKKDSELQVNDKWYQYAALHPGKDATSKFNQVMTYLLRKDSAALVRVGVDLEVLILNNCDITQKLGMSEARNYSILLHVICISSKSRKEDLRSISLARNQAHGNIPAMNPPLPQGAPGDMSKTPPEESIYDSGFKNLVTADSLLYKQVLVRAFYSATVLQEQINAQMGLSQMNRGVEPLSPQDMAGVGVPVAPPGVAVPSLYPQPGIPGFSMGASNEHQNQVLGQGPLGGQHPDMMVSQHIQAGSHSSQGLQPPGFGHGPSSSDVTGASFSHLPSEGSTFEPMVRPSGSAQGDSQGKSAAQIQADLALTTAMLQSISKRIEQEKNVSTLPAQKTDMPSDKAEITLPKFSDSESGSEHEEDHHDIIANLEMTDALADIIVRGAPLAAKAVRESVQRDPRLFRKNEPRAVPEDKPSPVKTPPKPPAPKATTSSTSSATTAPKRRLRVDGKENNNNQSSTTQPAAEVVGSAQEMKALLNEVLVKIPKEGSAEDRAAENRKKKLDRHRRERHSSGESDGCSPEPGLRKQMQGLRREQLKSWLASQPPAGEERTEKQPSLIGASTSESVRTGASSAVAKEAEFTPATLKSDSETVDAAVKVSLASVQPSPDSLIAVGPESPETLTETEATEVKPRNWSEGAPIPVICSSSSSDDRPILSLPIAPPESISLSDVCKPLNWLTQPKKAITVPDIGQKSLNGKFLAGASDIPRTSHRGLPLHGRIPGETTPLSGDTIPRSREASDRSPAAKAKETSPDKADGLSRIEVIGEKSPRRSFPGGKGNLIYIQMQDFPAASGSTGTATTTPEIMKTDEGSPGGGRQKYGATRVGDCDFDKKRATHERLPSGDLNPRVRSAPFEPLDMETDDLMEDAIMGPITRTESSPKTPVSGAKQLKSPSKSEPVVLRKLPALNVSPKSLGPLPIAKAFGSFSKTFVPAPTRTISRANAGGATKLPDRTSARKPLKFPLRMGKSFGIKPLASGAKPYDKGSAPAMNAAVSSLAEDLDFDMSDIRVERTSPKKPTGNSDTPTAFSDIKTHVIVDRTPLDKSPVKDNGCKKDEKSCPSEINLVKRAEESKSKDIKKQDCDETARHKAKSKGSKSRNDAIPVKEKDSHPPRLEETTACGKQSMPRPTVVQDKTPLHQEQRLKTTEVVESKNEYCPSSPAPAPTKPSRPEVQAKTHKPKTEPSRCPPNLPLKDGKPLQEMRITISQKPAKIGAELPDISEDKIIAGSTLVALHGIKAGEAIEEDPEEEARVFLWYYGIHLLPQELRHLKKKENNALSLGGEARERKVKLNPFIAAGECVPCTKSVVYVQDVLSSDFTPSNELSNELLRSFEAANVPQSMSCKILPLKKPKQSMSAVPLSREASFTRTGMKSSKFASECSGTCIENDPSVKLLPLSAPTCPIKISHNTSQHHQDLLPKEINLSEKKYLETKFLDRSLDTPPLWTFDEQKPNTDDQFSSSSNETPPLDYSCDEKNFEVNIIGTVIAWPSPHVSNNTPQPFENSGLSGYMNINTALPKTNKVATPNSRSEVEVERAEEARIVYGPVPTKLVHEADEDVAPRSCSPVTAGMLSEASFEMEADHTALSRVCVIPKSVPEPSCHLQKDEASDVLSSKTKETPPRRDTNSMEIQALVTDFLKDSDLWNDKDSSASPVNSVNATKPNVDKVVVDTDQLSKHEPKVDKVVVDSERISPYEPKSGKVIIDLEKLPHREHKVDKVVVEPEQVSEFEPEVAKTVLASELLSQHEPLVDKVFVDLKKPQHEPKVHPISDSISGEIHNRTQNKDLEHVSRHEPVVHPESDSASGDFDNLIQNKDAKQLAQRGPVVHLNLSSDSVSVDIHNLNKDEVSEKPHHERRVDKVVMDPKQLDQHKAVLHLSSEPLSGEIQNKVSEQHSPKAHLISDSTSEDTLNLINDNGSEKLSRHELMEHLNSDSNSRDAHYLIQNTTPSAMVGSIEVEPHEKKKDAEEPCKIVPASKDKSEKKQAKKKEVDKVVLNQNKERRASKPRNRKNRPRVVPKELKKALKRLMKKRWFRNEWITASMQPYVLLDPKEVDRYLKVQKKRKPTISIQLSKTEKESFHSRMSASMRRYRESLKEKRHQRKEAAQKELKLKEKHKRIAKTQADRRSDRDRSDYLDDRKTSRKSSVDTNEPSIKNGVFGLLADSNSEDLLSDKKGKSKDAKRKAEDYTNEGLSEKRTNMSSGSCGQQSDRYSPTVFERFDIPEKKSSPKDAWYKVWEDLDKAKESDAKYITESRRKPSSAGTSELPAKVKQRSWVPRGFGTSLLGTEISEPLRKFKIPSIKDLNPPRDRSSQSGPSLAKQACEPDKSAALLGRAEALIRRKSNSNSEAPPLRESAKVSSASEKPKVVSQDKRGKSFTISQETQDSWSVRTDGSSQKDKSPLLPTHSQLHSWETNSSDSFTSSKTLPSASLKRTPKSQRTDASLSPTFSRFSQSSTSAKTESARYHPYRRPKVPPPTPDLDRLKDYCTKPPNELITCLTSKCYQARLQIGILRAEENIPLPYPKFVSHRFRRSVWNGEEPGDDMRARPRINDPNEVDQVYTEQDMEHFETRRIVSEQIESLLESEVTEDQIPDMDMENIEEDGGVGTTGQIAECMPEGSPGNDPHSTDQQTSHANRADDETCTVVVTNGTLGKKKKKRAKWPGLKYEVSVPLQRHAYIANPDQEGALQLLDSVIIDAKDPRQSSELPTTSIYIQSQVIETTTTTVQVDQNEKITSAISKGSAAPEERVVETPASAVTPVKVATPKLTISIQNDHHKPPSPTLGVTPVDESLRVKDVTPEEVREAPVPPGNKNEVPEASRVQEPGREEEAAPAVGPSGFAEEKVHSWITASEPFFPEAAQEAPVESTLSANTVKTTAVTKTTSNVQSVTKPIKDIHSSKKTVPKLPPRDFASEVLNLQPRSIELSGLSSQAKHDKKMHVGALSPLAKKMADNQDATDAVVSALHQSREEVGKDLADVVNMSNHAPRKLRQAPVDSSTPKRKDSLIGLDEETVLLNSGTTENDQAESSLRQRRTVFLSSRQIPIPHKQGLFPIARREGKSSTWQQPEVTSSKPALLKEEFRGHDENGLAEHHDEHGAGAEKVRSVELVETSPAKEEEEEEPEPERVNWSATYEKLNTISQYTARSSYREEFHNKAIDKMFKSKKKRLMYGLDQLYNGETLSLPDLGLGQDFKHFKGLSLGTQLESNFAPESNVVKQARYDSFKEWLTKKPLDLYLLGKLDISDIKTEDIKPSVRTDETIMECLEDFNAEVFELLKGKKTSEDTSNVFAKPRNETEETIGNVFRQVRQYMDFVVRQADKPVKEVAQGCHGCSAEESPPRWRSQTPNREQVYTESSGEGSDEGSEADRSRRHSKKHKHKKKKRKHKKRSRSPDKRKRHHHHHKSKGLDEERPERENEEYDRPVNNHKEKTDNKHTSKEHRPRSSKKKRAKPKARDTGMTHIMDEFYGDVESIVNSAEVTGDESIPADQHLPRFTAKAEEEIPSQMDHVIKEEMTKTKLCLTEIVQPMEDNLPNDLIDDMEITAEAIINAQSMAEEAGVEEPVPEGVPTTMPLGTLEQNIQPEAARISVEALNEKRGARHVEVVKSVEDTTPSEKIEVSGAVIADAVLYSPENADAAEVFPPETERSLDQEKEKETTAEVAHKEDFKTKKERKYRERRLSESDARLLERETDAEKKRTRTSSNNNSTKRTSSASSKSPHSPRKKFFSSSGQSERPGRGSRYLRSIGLHDKQQLQATDQPHRKNPKRRHSPTSFKMNDPMYLVEKQAKKISEAIPMDTTFVDSFLSKSVDVYGETPGPNFDPLFDITKTPPCHSGNPYSKTWAVLQYFLSEDKSYLTDHLENWLPDINKFKTSKVWPNNSFLWALSLATGKTLPTAETVDKSVLTDDWLEFSVVDGDMNEYGSSTTTAGALPQGSHTGDNIISPSKPANVNQEEHSPESSSESSVPSGALYRPDSGGKNMKKPMKRNPLALAFKQAVEAKKQGTPRPVTSGLAFKRQKIGIKMTTKLGSGSADDRSRAKVLEDKLNKEITAIPYDTNNPVLLNKAPPESPSISSSLTFEPEMSGRIDDVVADAVHDFLNDMKHVLSETLGNEWKGSLKIPNSFQHQGNQVMHLHELSACAGDMYKRLSAHNSGNDDVELVDAGVQTLQGRKSTTQADSVSPEKDNKPQPTSSKHSPIISIAKLGKDRIPPIPTKGSDTYMPEEPTSANESDAIMDVSRGDKEGGSGPDQRTDLPDPEVNSSKPSHPLTGTPSSTRPSWPVRQANLKRTSLSQEEQMVQKRQKLLALAAPVSKPSDSKLESTDPPVENQPPNEPLVPPQLPTQVPPPTLPIPGQPAHTVPSPNVSQTVTAWIGSDPTTTACAPMDAPKPTPVIERMMVVKVKDVSSAESPVSFSPTVVDSSSVNPPSIPALPSPAEISTAHIPVPSTGAATTTVSKFTEVKLGSEEANLPKAPTVRFSMSKTGAKVTVPKAFTPIVVTTVTITSPLPPVLQPVIAISSPTHTTSSLSAVIASVQAGPAAPIPKESDGSMTTPATDNRPSDDYQGAAVMEAPMVGPQPYTSNEPVREAMNPQPAPSQAVSQSPVKPTPSQASSIGLVSLDNDIHIPGLGTPEQSTIQSPDPHLVSYGASSNSSTPAYQGSETPSSGGSTPVFDIDAIPLPPGVKSSGAKDSKWLKWKKKQKTEKWRKDAESEFIPPVSTLTQWPPPSPVEEQPPTLPPPPMPPLSITSTWNTKTQATDEPNSKPQQPSQQQQTPQLPPPPQPPPNFNMWYNQQQQQQQQSQQQPPQSPQQQQQYGQQWQGWDQQGWGNQWGQGQWGGGGGWDQRNPGYWERPGYWDQHHMPPRHPPPFHNQQWRPQGDWRHHQYNQWRQPQPQPQPQWGPPPPPPQQQQHFPGPPHQQGRGSGPSSTDPEGPPGTEDENWGQPSFVAPPGEDVSQPVTLGSPQTEKRTLPANNVRMLVFNKDQPICKSVERFMSFMGAKTFDPYNLNVMKLLKSVETLVLVHVEDVPKIHQIPNLLALKQQDWVKFVTYENVSDVQRKTYTLILKSGGLAVVDDNILLTMQPGTLEEMCEFMLEQRRTEGIPWRLVLQGHIMHQLLNPKPRADRLSRMYDLFIREEDRLRQLHMVLTRYEEEGVVWILRSPEYDNTPRPPQEYLPVTLKLQADNCHTHRHVILLSDLPQTDQRTLPFLRQGISVMNISSFMRIVVKKLSLPPVPQTRPYYGMKGDDMFLDTYLSSAVDMLPNMPLPADPDEV